MNHLEAHADRIAGLIAGAGDELPLFVTGAGVSVASGIPTFRGADPDAIWRKNDIELATFRALKATRSASGTGTRAASCRCAASSPTRPTGRSRRSTSHSPGRDATSC